MNKFNEDYYEHGLEKKISGYTNYSWMPARSISEATSICQNIDFDSCIDYGCAKGFLVKALNLLGKQAIGIDISEYAISHCPPDVKDKLFLLNKTLGDMNFSTDLLIAKDVLEHVPEQDIPGLLRDFRMICKQAFLTIPLGDNNLFRIREYEIDVTHITKKDEEWWINKIRDAKFNLKKFDYSLGHVKENWVKNYPFGNGFFILD